MGLSQDDQIRLIYRARAKSGWYQQAKRQSAVESAIKDTKIEIANNALKMNIALDDIVKLTGLSIEEIQNLNLE